MKYMRTCCVPDLASTRALYLTDLAAAAVAGADRVVVGTERLYRQNERAVAALLAAADHHRHRVDRLARLHLHAAHAHAVVARVSSRHLQ